MTRDRLDEIKNKWNIPVTLPMAVPYGKDDVVWLVQEIERLRAENVRLRADLTQFQEMAGAVRLALRHVGEKP